MNKIIELIAPNIDEFGIIASRDKGDSPLDCSDTVFTAYIWRRLGLITGDELKEVLNRFNSVVPKLMILDNEDPRFYGLCRRHCDTTRWYGDWNRFSRDQGHFILGLALSNNVKALDAFMKSWRRRLYLWTTNTLGNSDTTTARKLPDGTGPGFWAYAIRCKLLSGTFSQRMVVGPYKIIIPLLTALDLSLVIDSLVRVYWHGKDKNETDSRNHLKALGLSKLVGDTFLAKLARKLYKNMPIKFPNRPGTGPEQEVDDYFKSNGGVVGLAELWKPVIAWILE